MKRNAKKVTLSVKSLESKVTPYCCPNPDDCYAAGGTFYYTGYGDFGPLGDCSVDPWGGKLAAVADF